MADIIVTGILLIIIGGAIRYIVKAKKAGAKCIGCPEGCRCSESGHSACSCKSHASDT